jgi:hypothetical protein
MRFSINDYSISPKAKGWGLGWPNDRSGDMARVKADRSETAVNVHKGIARLVDLLLDETENRGYRLVQDQTGGYNNRPIRDTNRPSNHSWGLAVDLNWRRNPASNDGQIHGDFPDWLVPLWGRYGFAWGGNYRRTGFRDPMHLEFMGAPEDADDKTLAARRRLGGERPERPEPTPAPVPPAVPDEPPPFVPKQRVHTYVVKGGDTLFQIATRLHVPGGWPALYRENLAVIGDNPDLLFPGQLLTLP